MLLSTLAASLAIAGQASAFWRMPCPSRLIDERIDPIISPGQVAGHVHTVSGGNGFGYTMDYSQARASQCSSCPIKQDLSNYWTPKLYFHAPNGSFIGVPQAGDGNGVLGGTTVYYLQRGGPNNDHLVAFPKGFRMVAGNPFQRNFTGTFAAQAASFVCLDYNGESSMTNGLPTKNCPDGVRTQIFFPSCWDGKNNYLPDSAHVAYPESGSFDNGPCPASHPVHLVSIFYETIFQTNIFADQWGNSRSSPTGQPFVFANGDPTGYGMHGDFVNGWDVPTLQKAVDTCTNLSGLMSDCPVFEYFTNQESNACKTPVTQGTNVNGPRMRLPGCNELTYGPELAQPPATCARIPKVFLPRQPYSDQRSLGYKYIGCGTDSTSSRTLTGANDFSGGMTVKSCVSFCKSKGYTYAGLEYATQCFCGNSLPTAAAPQPGIIGGCDQPCAGDSSEICGAGNALSLYQACASSSDCQNHNNGIVGGLPPRKRVKRAASLDVLDLQTV